METIQATVRCTVFAFVFIAGAVTFAGLDPAIKADTVSLTDSEHSEGPTNNTSLVDSKKDVIVTAAGSTG